jgi:hypothetical protein
MPVSNVQVSYISPSVKSVIQGSEKKIAAFDIRKMYYNYIISNHKMNIEVKKSVFE